MDNKDLQSLLDSLDEGPLGVRSEGQWDQYNTLLTNSMSNAKDKDVRKKISNNTDWKALRKKQVENTDYTKHRDMFREYNVKRRKKVKAFTVVKKKRVIVNKTLIGTYDSILQCSKELGLLQGGISNILNPNHVAQSYKGYTFEYA